MTTRANEIRERLAKAPRKPWRAFIATTTISLIGDGVADLIHWSGFDSSILTAREERVALLEFIAAAPKDIASLLGRVEELEFLVDWAHGVGVVKEELGKDWTERARTALEDR